MTPLVHIGHFSDTCADLGENVKIIGAYLRHLEKLGNVFPIINLVPVQNTVDVGFNLSEAITNPEAAARMILIGNYAPPDNPNGTDNNVRKSFYAAAVEFGGRRVPIVTTLNGFELSYLKSQVSELYEIRSDNGNQFRSLTLAPRTGVEFSDDTLRQNLVASGAITRLPDLSAIPDVPDVSHVVHIDNFRNVKIWLSKRHQKLIEETGQNGGKITISFLPESVDPHGTIAAHDTSLGTFSASPRDSFFNAALREIILTTRSSSFYSNDASVPQIAQVRTDPVRDPVDFPIPLVGQRIKIQPAGAA